MKKSEREKLRLWQERLEKCQSAYQVEADRMDGREALYRGTNELRGLVPGEKKRKTPHVRNLCAELVEAQVESSIPQPKVTARRKKDEPLAKLIEDMLRNELDRLPFEQINDMLERTVPIQGGAAFLLEWDNTRKTHYTVGELAVSMLHPKQILPQDGVYTGIEDMDYIILKIPQTKEFIRRRYGVDVSGEDEGEPETRGSGDTASDDLVTQYMAYYRNDENGIGLFSWVNDKILEDLTDYQARRLRRCKTCGAVEPLLTEPLGIPTPDGTYPLAESMAPEALSAFPAEEGMAAFEQSVPAAEGMAMEGPRVPGAPEGEIGANRLRGGRRVCPYCGGSQWEESEEEYEELTAPVFRSDGTAVGGPGVRIPFYKPGLYPVILQKNVSVYGSFLGDSDLDKIADQQNTTNRIEAKIIDKLVKSGSVVTMPEDCAVRFDAEDMKPVWVTPQDKAMIGVYDLQGDVSADLAYLSQVYEEARQIIGITDSFQGRRDTTATSGKAKEFSAAQSAGRLESKRVMKYAAFAALFEAMFKFKLAYADEPRPVVSEDLHGNPKYDTFNRYDFLEQDAAGEWCWNDRFLFSCDTSAPLAGNREAMWQETRMNLQTGAFGNPAELSTLILFWTKMELLHYPGAGETRSYLEEELKQQEVAAMQQAQQAAAMQQQGAAQLQQQGAAQLQQMQQQGMAQGAEPGTEGLGEPLPFAH